MKFTAGRGWGSACIKTKCTRGASFRRSGLYSIASIAKWEA